jgi:putative membrane-bound dehydrogenase-like protein
MISSTSEEIPGVMRALATFVPFALIGMFLSGLAAQQKPFDLKQIQSPPKPAPEGLKFIDQGQFDQRLKGYLTPEGFKVEIIAEEPVVINPVGMTFGDDGSLYVLEWRPVKGQENNFPESSVTFTYKDGSKRKVAIMKKPIKDLLKLLLEGGKGLYPKSKNVLEDELPSSILLHEDKIYLTGQGTVRAFEQSKPGGPYDVKKIIAQGFCGFHHHQVSGLTLGNEGWLYITSGDDDNVVEGFDGSRATVLRTGAIFRCRPDGSKMHTYALGFRNPYRDVAFDTAFNMFHADNDNEDGSKFTGCRLMHVAEGSDFGWRLKIGARCCQPDNFRGAAFGELPGKVTPMLKTGRGAPAGLLIYNDTYLPEAYRGLLYYPDVFRKLIRAYKVRPKGATFEVVEEFEFLKSNDPLFRPCQMVLGPDGAMYICDWRTDSGGAGRLWGDGKHGRIYRVTWAGTKDQPAIPRRGMDSWAKVLGQKDDELLGTLSSDNFSDRQKAQRELVRRGAKHRPALLKLLKDGDQKLFARIAALGALQSFWNKEVPSAFLELLQDPEPDLRRLAADGLALNAPKGDADVYEALIQVLNDQNPAARRAIILAIGKVGAPAAADTLATTLQFSDGKDEYLHDGIIRAIERLGARGMEKLLDLADSGVDRDRDRVVEAFQAMRSEAAAAALPKLLKNPHLSVAQRAALVRSFNNYLLDPPISLDPVLPYLKGDAKSMPVVQAALEVLSASGALGGEKLQSALQALLDQTDSSVRLAVIDTIEKTRLTKAGPKLAKLLGDAARPAAERAAIARTLGVLRDKSAVPILKGILSDKKPATPETAELRIEALRALEAIEPKTARKLAEGFLEKGDLVMQKGAAQVLGAQPAGAKLVGQRYLAKKLPKELLWQVTDALRKHAGKNAEINKLLAEVMKGGLTLTLNPDEVKHMKHLVLTKGDPKRGRDLYLNGKVVTCITCHRLEGVGGNVGPDLTRIWDTHTIEKTLEAIIDPSKEIKEGYQSYILTTKKGQVYTGLKVSQTAEEVVLRDQNAKEIRVPAKEIDELVVSKKSLMPDDVVKQLTFEQFIDLVAFLKDRQAQESLRGQALEFWVVGPFSEDLKKSYAPEEKADPAATYPGSKPGQKLSWEVRQAEPNGYLNLRAVFNADHISAYALTYVYSPKAQKAAMLVGSDDMAKVWLNGKLVHEYTQPRSAKPDDDRVTITLKEGWNTVLVRVVNVALDHGLYLRFTDGEGLRVAVKKE